MTGALTGCGGGGWTLAMKINGQKVFSYRKPPNISPGAYIRS